MAGTVTQIGASTYKVTVPIEQPKYNILCCVLDDWGTEYFHSYDAINVGYKSTLTADQLRDTYGIYGNCPNLAAFAASGVQFMNARSLPVCSPTRAGLYSGRYPSRTGIGNLVTMDRAGNKRVEFGMDVALPGQTQYSLGREYVIAEIAKAAGYKSAIFGKWHLCLLGDDNTIDPHNTNEQVTLANGVVYRPASWTHLNGVGKWDHWYINLRNFSTNPQPYLGTAQDGTYGVIAPDGKNGGFYGRERFDTATTLYNGASSYAQKVTVDKALAWMNDPANQPWIVYVTFHLPHTPFHDPRPAGYTIRSVYTNQFNNPSFSIQGWAYRQAMAETADVEVGRLMNGLTGSINSNTMKFITADNGTERNVMQGAYDLYDAQGTVVVDQYGSILDRFKGTVYDGGVHVPLMVQGPLARYATGTTSRTNQALIDIHVDLYETFRNIMHQNYEEVAGPQPADGISFLPAIQNPTVGITAHERKYQFIELFRPNGDPREVDSQGYIAADVRRERAYYRLLTTSEVSANAAYYVLLRIYDSTTKTESEEFYKFNTTQGLPGTMDWQQLTNLKGNPTYAEHYNIVKAEMDAKIAEVEP